MARFDVDAALKAGYSEDEIADHLGRQSGMDTKAARQAGYTSRELLGELSKALPRPNPAQRVGTEKGRGTLTDPLPVPEPRVPRTRGGLPSENKPFVGGDARIDAGMPAYFAGDNSVLDKPAPAGMQPAQGEGALSLQYVAEVRGLMANLAPEDRQRTLQAITQRPDAMGRAAREVLRQAGIESQGISLEDERTGALLRTGPNPQGPNPAQPPRPAIPNPAPNFADKMDGTAPADIAMRRENAMAVKDARTGQRAVSDRAYLEQNRDQINASATRDDMAENSPHLAAMQSGIAGSLGGLLNAPAVAADYLNQLVVNPVARAVGAEGFARAPNMPGADYFARAAKEYMPKLASGGMEKAWDDGKFIPWLTMNMAAQAPQMAQQVVAAMAPPLRALILPAMGAQAAGNSYQDGDSSSAALSKGIIEAGSELLPLGVFDKVKEAILALPASARGTAVTEAMKRLTAAGAAITAGSLAEALGEGASAVGQNLVDIGASGKSKDVLDGVGEAMVLGGAMGGAMGLPNAATAMQDNSAGAQAAKAINQNAKAFASFFKPGADAIAPTQARAESVKRLDEMAAAFGLSPKALSAVREQAGAMPADEVPEFLSRAVQAMNKRQLFARPLDPAALADLAKRLRPEPLTKAKAQDEPSGQDQIPVVAPAVNASADDAGRDGVARDEGPTGAAVPPTVAAPEFAIPPAPESVQADDLITDEGAPDVNVPDVAGTAGIPAAAADGRLPADVGGELAVRRVATDPGERQPAAAPGAVGRGRPANPAGDGNRPDDALTTLDTLADGFKADPRATSKTYETVLRGYAADVRSGKLTPEQVAPQIQAYTELLARPIPAPAPPAEPEVDDEADTPADTAPFTTGDTFTLAGKAYTVTKAGPKSAVISSEDGKKRTVTPDGKTWAAMLEQKTSAAVPEQAAEAESRETPAPAAVAGPAAAEPAVPAAASGAVEAGGLKTLRDEVTAAYKVANGFFGKDTIASGIQNDWQRLLDAADAKDTGKLLALEEKYRADEERDGLGAGTSGAGPGKVKQSRRGAAQIPRFGRAIRQAIEREATPGATPTSAAVEADGLTQIATDDDSIANVGRALTSAGMEDFDGTPGRAPRVWKQDVGSVHEVLAKVVSKPGEPQRIRVTASILTQPDVSVEVMTPEAAVAQVKEYVAKIEEFRQRVADKVASTRLESEPSKLPAPLNAAAPDATKAPEQSRVPEAAAPAKPPPKSFRKKQLVTTPVLVEETGKFEAREIDADTALTAIEEDIKAMRAFRACIGG